ncbi:hypothetical protein D1007_19164 [Hordeum vulgare]|nr:hypothetical protein D1007_19164 [Hordeum vulgare]
MVIEDVPLLEMLLVVDQQGPTRIRVIYASKLAVFGYSPVNFCELAIGSITLEVWGSKKDQDYHVDLALDIINPYYRDMKAEGEKNKRVCHRAWVKRLDEYHIQITAKETYTCYEMFRRIINMRKCLLPKHDEGSSRKESGGDKRHKK